MPTFTKKGVFFLLPVLFIGCAGGGGRAGSEIPVATTNDPLPQRQAQSAQNPNTSGIAASRSEPIIYDYPGATRNLNAPAPTHASPVTPATGTPSKPLTAPLGGAARFHTVQSGDTLWGLSKKYSVSIDAIRTANAMTTDVIKPGQTLKIP
jgi:LysM repeat protein